MANAAWFGAPGFASPVFDANAMLLIAPVAIILVAENLGHIKAVTAMTGRNLDAYMGRAFIGDGVATMVSGASGGTGVTTYAENIGVMAATKIYSTAVFVVAAVIATGAFTLGGITSILYLLKARSTKDTGYLARLPELTVLDRVSYRMHAFGFPVWTFGVLISGPIWAHQAWSSYWNWDPKEVWAFITWVVYAAYLHARATAGCRGRNAAILSLFFAATLFFNFIVINFFSTTSQHSYAEGARVERTVERTEPSVVVGLGAGLRLPVETAQEVRVVVGAEGPRA